MVLQEYVQFFFFALEITTKIAHLGETDVILWCFSNF